VLAGLQKSAIFVSVLLDYIE